MSWLKIRSAFGGGRSGDGWRFVVIAALAVWWGGLTFYALVVVPLGTKLLGSQTQGTLSENVTRILNLLGVLVIGLLLDDVLRCTTRLKWTAWAVFVACQIALFIYHGWLILDQRPARVTDSVEFFNIHRLYLLTTAVQWVCGLCLLKMLVKRGSSG